jgi:hypothetical protein
MVTSHEHRVTTRIGENEGADMARRRWADLTGRQRAVVLALASIQLSLAASAWADLATRPADQVNVRKAMWAAIIAVNFVGPLSYFGWGRRPRQ